MTGKPINWGKLYSITGTAAVVFAAAGWVFVKASAYAALPGTVANHETRITALESQNATNAVRLDDRLDRIDSDLKVIFKRLNGQDGQDGQDGQTKTNAYAAQY